ncbi:methionine--tRNA ligase [Candidatus Falkowbacteria bacterium]|nr:methionine--tRNA ligase [Candidatus Falkowbacteria bacterium]
MKNKFYITTPIYYVNDKPHIGHAYTTVLADVLARYHRLMGEEVFFSVGTDEHGAKIEAAAEQANKSPREFCDENAEAFKEAWRSLNISYDNFIRTTNPKHEKAVSNVLDYLYKKDFIYEGVYKGLYCRGCEQYKTDDDLVGGRCPDHQIEPEVMEEDSYFFRLSKFGAELGRSIADDKFKVEPAERKNEVLNFIRNGLQDISISRKKVKWGVPLPFSAEGGSASGGDKKFTTYVWIDAFLNYLTGLGWDGKKNSKWNKFGANASKIQNSKLSFWPPDVQLMSKDILRVHATIWPALLLALKIPLPKKLYIHGFFTIDSQKMSKSVGNVIWPEQLVEKFGVDGARYLLMSSLAHGHDGDVSWEKMAEKYNTNLANGLGNLVSRVMNLAKGFNIAVRDGSLKIKSEKARKLLDEIKLKEALDEIWKEVDWANKYVEETRLWELVKANKKEARKVLEELLAAIISVAESLKPFMPATAEKIIKILESGEMKKGEILFPRI